jgi:farnesyl diphosphate synthase
MRYATLSGGKRLRPMLVCAACTAVGGALEDALAPACAVEFIHAYSLVHDDLPAMDNDDVRHGLPSNHVRFGEANAILAGDALQALAFRTLAEAPNVPVATRLRALVLLSDAAGWQGMVGGQSFDLASESRQLPLAHLEALHAAKTGALIQAAVQIGAVVGNPTLDDERFVLLGEFAARVGHAFQVIDDVLDVTATSDELGKPAGSDTAADKSTYPRLMGVGAARKQAQQLLADGLKFLRRAELGDTLLAELARRSVEREF